MIDERFFGKIKKIKVSELATMCGLKMQGSRDFEIEGVETLKKASSQDLSFFGNKKYKDDLKNTKAGAVIIAEADVKNLPNGVVALIAPHVMISYAKVLNTLCYSEEHLSHICSTAIISESAKIGEHCYIGEHVIIGEGVEIGENSVIGANTVIEKNCKIGSNALIRNNVTISHTLIGDNVIIHSGARIGEAGFGILPTGGKMMYVKQLGRVIIGDRVRIGANTTIDRGSLEDTEIGNDTVIDNLVQIAHNVHIGERSIIVAQVGIAGSSQIGNDVVLAGQVGISGHVHIGDKAVVAAQGGVASDIDAGKVVGGSPAVDVMIWRRQAALLKMMVTKKKNVDLKISMWQRFKMALYEKLQKNNGVKNV